LRSVGPNGLSDTLHVGLDQQVVATAEKVRFYPYGTWLWTATRMGSTAKVAIQVDTAGVHTLNLWMRESGTIVDRILVTPDKTYVPTGDGPAEVGRPDHERHHQNAPTYRVQESNIAEPPTYKEPSDEIAEGRSKD
jgi:hypothetical protein